MTSEFLKTGPGMFDRRTKTWKILKDPTGTVVTLQQLFESLLLLLTGQEADLYRGDDELVVIGMEKVLQARTHVMLSKI